MIGLVLVSVTGVILRTVPSIMESQLGLLRAIEFGTVAVFTIEFLLRLWVADLSTRRSGRGLRVGYLLSAEGLVDLAAVVPFYLALAFPAGIPVFAAVALLRIFKLVRYSPALATLLAVIVNERKVLLGMLTIMLVLLLFSSTVVYLVERTAQPMKFGSIPAAMWWGIATLTTVGYGDVTPITPLGKLFGSVVEILGIGMFALPAGILSSGFARELRQREMLNIARLVRGVPLFSKLNAQNVAQIAQRLHPLVVQAGDTVVSQGEEARGMFFVSEGQLEVEVGEHRETLHTDFFGEIALLEGGVRSATIRALTRCRLLVLEQVHFDELLATDHRIDEAVRAIALVRKAADERRQVTTPPADDS
jgi:voltage-gated potassium channel